MFDGALSFDRVLMPASQASTALRHPLPPLRGPPPAPLGSVSLDSQSSIDSLRIQFPCHRERGEARFWERGPPPPASGGRQGFGNVVPCHREQGGEARFEVETRSPSPCKQGEARFWVNRPSPPCFSCPPPLRGWVASGARRKGESIFFLPTPT